MDFPKCFDLEGKVVVLTGGAGVLCSNMAKAIGKCGGKVVILDINENAMEELGDELEDINVEYLTIKTNVQDKESVEKAAEKVIKKYGNVDVLINGAGGNRAEATTDADTTFFDLPMEGVRKVFDLNFFGTFIASQVFGEILSEQEEGVILNVSSMAAMTPLTKTSAYSAAKAAVSNFTKWLAVYISHNYSTKIRVNAIAPGFLLTEQNRYLLIDQETEEYTNRGENIIENTPMDRFGKPEDLLTTVLWLISPGSEFVHGAIIPIDGGYSSFSGV